MRDERLPDKLDTWDSKQMVGDRTRRARPVKLRIRQRLRRLRFYKRLSRLEQVPEVRRLTDEDLYALRKKLNG